MFVRDIIRATAQTGGLTVPGLLADGSHDVARLRFIGILASVRLTTRSYQGLAQDWQRRDHTTILHAVRRAEALIAQGDVMAGERLRGLLHLLDVPALPEVRPAQAIPTDRVAMLQVQIGAAEQRLAHLRADLAAININPSSGAVQ
jgi:hypothetical protein